MALSSIEAVAQTSATGGVTETPVPESVLFVIGSLDSGGAERQVLELAAALRSRGVRVGVLTLMRPGTLAAEATARGIEVLDCGRRPATGLIGRALGVLSSVWRARGHLRRWKPQIVHFFLPEAYILGSAAVWLAGGSPRLVMSRRSLNHYQRKRPWLVPVERWLHRRMHLVLANSEAVAADLRAEGVPPERLRVIHNGVKPYAPTRTRAELRAELGIGEATVLIVMVANLIPYKGHLDVLTALQGLEGDWFLLCLGRDDGFGDTLRARAEALAVTGRVRFPGESLQARDWLSAADVGLLASHQEGFSNALLEYMSAGLACVATQVGGNAEALADGECGMLVPTRDPRALRELLAGLLSDRPLRERLGVAAARRAAGVYSPEACVEATLAAYRGAACADGQDARQRCS
jgi:glycosyltransferase involved in cell wall biosynthesis